MGTRGEQLRVHSNGSQKRKVPVINILFTLLVYLRPAASFYLLVFNNPVLEYARYYESKATAM